MCLNSFALFAIVTGLIIVLIAWANVRHSAHSRRRRGPRATRLRRPSLAMTISEQTLLLGMAMLIPVVGFVIYCNIWYWRLPQDVREQYDNDLDRYW